MEVVVSNVKQSLPFLNKWMDEEVPTGSDLHVIFGSKDKSYIAYAASAGSVWRNIPSGLEESIQKRADSPAQVALGKGGAYYVRWRKGDCTYALRTNYPDADKIIDDADSPPEVRTMASPNVDSKKTRLTDMQEQFVALNPYETDQYFILLANGEVHWRIPSASSSTVQDVIRANHGSAVAEYPRSDDRHTLENVRTGLSIGASALSIGHTVAGIAGGAALCNVM